MKSSSRHIFEPDEKGESYPLGSTLYPGGVNFSLFCRNGTLVELLLFDNVDDINPSRIITLSDQDNKSYHYWHIFIKHLQAGQLYAYRIHGPYKSSQGHWFDAEKILLDPYAKAVAIPAGYRRRAFTKPGNVSVPAMKSVVADLSVYDWEGDRHLRRPFSQTIIYELHVGGFTRHSSSEIESAKRGTFAGVVEKIPYLLDLGITAVELLPVFQFDEQDAPDGLINYWGYSPVSFFALHQRYGMGNNPLQILDEFRDMVKAFHKAGIEVILDVVYNHTAEGGIGGPTYCFRGIDNSIYYLLDKDSYSYANYSGCGNTLNANHPIVRRLILDSLHFWVTEMHVDGFRFDLASILSRDENGKPLKNPPLLWDIESDPVFSGVKLIAEAWDAAGLYQVGSFVGDSWKEWNGKFRDDVRSFIKGDKGMISKLVTRLVGSPDMYGHQEREPERSINFVTCHDGFTLNDLVSYNQKHNEANRESNRDGENNNLSWNGGEEGETDNEFIWNLRNKQIRNFLTITLLSIGAPMISMGDEIRRTQNGNNNAYCQDNELAWFNWNLLNKNKEIHRFVKHLIRGRLRRDMSKPGFSMSLNQLLNRAPITWHGLKLRKPDWSYHSHSIAFTIKSLSGEFVTHFMLNAYGQALKFELPVPDPNGSWKRWIDTSLDSPDDICRWSKAMTVKGNDYLVDAHSIVVLISTA
jgi:glycogen operon protein